MAVINTLDVTLRDGGYRINFQFNSEHIAHILSNLNESGIEYVEIGYKNGSIKHFPNIGDTACVLKNIFFFVKNCSLAQKLQ